VLSVLISGKVFALPVPAQIHRLNWLKTTIRQGYGFLPSLTILESERYAFVRLAWNMLFTMAMVEVVAFT
jgi:hypothetical protein